jgi:oligoribonuclease NrnB/cAMP/cGMP phosphodiesterase (DHH superfamily)
MGDVRVRILIFSHESDLDGLYSAAIGLIRYPQAMAVFLGYGADNMSKMGNFISTATNQSSERGLIIIADLGLNDDLIELCDGILSKAAEEGWQVMWVDHHPWSEQATKAASKFAEIVHDSSGKKCAAELMYEKLVQGNEVGEQLARMAHTMDFFTKDQFLTPITELIRYYQTFPDFYERMLELAHKSAKGILWDVAMQTDYNRYSLLRDRAKSEVLAAVQVRPAGKHTVAYVPSSPYLNSSLFSEQVFSETGADLVLFYSAKGKVSIRRNTELISCREVAARLPEGGGHDYAAGAVFKSDPADVKAVITELEAAVMAALLPHDQQPRVSNTLKE